MSLVNAIPCRRVILRMMRRQGSRSTQLIHVPTDGLVCRAWAAMWLGLRSAGALRATTRCARSVAVAANGGGAVRHRRDNTNIRLRD